MKHLTRALLALVIATLASCSSAESDDDLLEAVARPNRDALPGGLFNDFLDGKYDSAGHPYGAEVFEGAARCTPVTGQVGALGIAASSGRDSAGVLCAGTTAGLGDGTFTLNVRALMAAPPAQTATGEAVVLEITVSDGGTPVASRSVTAADFGESGAERDLAVTFPHYGDGAVDFEVTWTATTGVRLSYVEVFRATPRLVLSPASRAGAGDTFQIEMQDPPADLSFRVECDGKDLTEVLTGMLTDGAAQWVETGFRTIVTAPASALFAGCATPSRVKVSAVAGGWVRETSRVTYLAEPIPCSYWPNDGDPGLVRVLLTGFEPFPADSDRDNSSKEAVEAYVNGPQGPGIAVMMAVLPVEYDAAPALLQDLIARCAPDVVVGFGQGRSAVDIETTAYNRKDSAAVAGGVPDNRGVVYGGEAIVAGGPAERKTDLPVDAILARLGDAGIQAGTSDDPGRYVCNNLFFTIMGAVAANPAMTGGFVHLPRIPWVGDTERETLRQTVASVVETTVDAQRERNAVSAM